MLKFSLLLNQNNLKKNFLKLEQKWIDIFNEDTKNFFSNNCDCGDYFK